MTLQIGSIGSEVEILQHALRAHGFNPGAIDGSFGAGTQAAVMIKILQKIAAQCDGVRCDMQFF